MGPALRGAAVIQGGQGRPPLQRDVVPQGHLFRCAPLQDAVPYEYKQDAVPYGGCPYVKEPLRWERLF